MASKMVCDGPGPRRTGPGSPGPMRAARRTSSLMSRAKLADPIHVAESDESLPERGTHPMSPAEMGDFYYEDQTQPAAHGLNTPTCDGRNRSRERRDAGDRDDSE